MLGIAPPRFTGFDAIAGGPFECHSAGLGDVLEGLPLLLGGQWHLASHQHAAGFSSQLTGLRERNRGHAAKPHICQLSGLSIAENPLPGTTRCDPKIEATTVRVHARF